MHSFNIYLSSKTNKTLFPGNTNTQFNCVLAQPLKNLLQYKVCLADCIITPELPENTIVHICSDLVYPSLYNDYKLCVLGLVAKNMIYKYKNIYTHVARDEVSAVSIWLTDEQGKPLQLTNEVLLTLKFKRLTDI